LSALVEVRFLPADRSVWIAPGSTILAAAEAAGLEVVTGCTRGMCGTDPVRVPSGAEGLASPAEHERGTLDRMGLGPDWRLACSARVERGPLVVELGTF
jgi:ferredoxin